MTTKELLKTRKFWIFIVLMICAGASEAGMAQWASAFAESALGVSKSVGDLAGPCGFAVFMGLSRVLYGKYGDKIDLTVFMMISGGVCFLSYLLTAVTNVPVLGLISCTACGFAVGIMWPGSLSITSKAIPTGGTAMFAFLALAGDVGGTVGPAVVGNVSEHFGNDLQTGVLAGIAFPLILVLCSALARRSSKRTEEEIKA